MRNSQKDLKFNENTAIILTHIPKCAGTSIRESLILPNISEDKIYRTSNFAGILKHKEDFQYLIGHWPFGIEKYVRLSNPVRKRDKLLITFLREPIDHLISFYYFQKQQINYSGYKNDLIGKDILQFYKTTPRALNLQTKFCSGVFYEQLYRRLGKSCGTNHQLNIAKHNLLNNFHFVGQFENLRMDMSEFAKKYNLKLELKYSESTKTISRPATEEIGDNTIGELKELNKLDVLLYEFALKNVFNK